MMRSVSFLSIAILMMTVIAPSLAEEGAPAPAAATAPAPIPAPAPVAAPKPPAVPTATPKPAPVERPKPVEAPKPQAAPPAPVSPAAEPERSGDMPPAHETKATAEPGAATNGLGAYLWPVFSFAMLVVGFVAGYFWRHQTSRRKLGGMTVRIGTWRGTP